MMRYLAAILFLFNCVALNAADLSAGELDIAAAFPANSSLVADGSPRSSIAMEEIYEDISLISSRPSQLSATNMSAATSSFSSDISDEKSSNSVPIPAILWLFGSILMGVAVMASRQFFPGSRF